MKKIAIFVEGQTELIFVREYLLKSYNYQNISIECYNLFAEDKLYVTEYPFQVPDAELFFQLINVGNDNAVLSRILQREQQLWNAGFYRIIGLRDMYSKQYRELTAVHGQIDEQLNKEIKEIMALTIAQKAKQAQNISFCFAIMETESWILGFQDCFEKVNPQLTTAYIKEKLGFDLAILDPEASFFHPAKILMDIYGLVGEQYDKKKGDVYKIMSYLEQENFKNLLNSDKCASFCHFVTQLTN